MRKKILLCLIVVCLCCGSISVQASSEQVTDVAEILSESEEVNIEKEIAQIEKMTNWDVMTVTTDDTNGKTSRAYAEEWYESRSECADGVVCLIDMENRMLYVATYGDAINYLTDSRIEEILDCGYEGASENDYESSFLAMLECMQSMYRKGIPDNQYEYDEVAKETISKEKRLTLKEMLIAIGVAVIVCFGSVIMIVGRYKMKWGMYRYSYRENGTLSLTEERDVLESTNVIHRRIPKSTHINSSRASGTRRSRSSTHRTSGGRRAGGGGRRF